MVQTDKITIVTFIVFNEDTKKFTVVFEWKDQLASIDCDTEQEAIGIQDQILAEIRLDRRMQN